MVEQEIKDDYKWHKVDIGNGHFIDEKTIDPEIMAQMPENAELFWEVGPIQLLIKDIRKVFKIGG
jgi:pentose-5-phosphate-3-epimerase